MPEVPIVRTAEESEFDDFVDTMDVSFFGDASAERRGRMRTWMDVGRMLVADDDGQVVATSAAWSWELSVPGGSLPVAAVTAVTVLPTHRRRGLLRAMMTRLTAEARERGEPLAALWASEGTIYGRFGFGPAGWTRELRGPLARGLALRGPLPPESSVRLLRAADAPEVLAPIFAAARARRGGLMDRGDAWWAGRLLADPPEARGGAGPLRVAVTGAEGYALYRVREGEEQNPVAAWTTVEVSELVGTTPEAERTLLAFLASIDLVDEIVLATRPIDDHLAHAPADARALTPGAEHDALWLRILDLPAAVAGRSWAAPVDLVLEVEHAEDPELAGRWRIAGGPDGATAGRTDAPADLALHARDLGSLYLGGIAAVTLRDAGAIHEATAGAAAALDAALHVDRAPWTAGIF